MPTSMYPTGTTIYDPDRSWNGYTIFQARDVGATLIDMSGNVVNQWKDLMGFPNRLSWYRLCLKPQWYSCGRPQLGICAALVRHKSCRATSRFSTVYMQPFWFPCLWSAL